MYRVNLSVVGAAKNQRLRHALAPATRATSEPGGLVRHWSSVALEGSRRSTCRGATWALVGERREGNATEMSA